MTEATRDPAVEAAYAAADAACPVEDAIRTLGGKRRMLIVRPLLLRGAARFNEILREVEGLSAKVLTQDLRALSRDGLVRRTVLTSSPLRVQYAMTAAGLELLPIYKALGAWRERLDARRAAAADD